MKVVLHALLLASLVACSNVTPDEARQIAYERLSSMEDAPAIQGEALRSALQVTDQSGGIYLVEVRDEKRNLIWAVIVQSSGESEITRMAIDG